MTALIDPRNPPDLKLAIRGDADGAWIRAFAATIDGTKAVELASVRRECLDGREGPIFRAWMECCKRMMELLCAAGGAPVEAWTGELPALDAESRDERIIRH